MAYIMPTMSNENLERELLEGEDCTFMVQCRAENGVIGTWLRHDVLNGRISPIFTDGYGLTRWLIDNNFKQIGSGSGMLRKYRKVY